ncbi:hypothetical protein [Lentibacillus cibarius]|uniref:Phage protein n=1 Tax=Lentibacillus cibarius TaxID=2583219 RepID=A0A5S3QMH5_9BACI|nr:hypothetical protein [Lentibacillus cibarius]TMN23162.1 hypothetical protein FFL34_14490 [Lentibacillus cibarius]
MKRYEKLLFELEFEKTLNDTYKGHVVVFTNIGGNKVEHGTVLLGEFESIKEMKLEFHRFEREFKALYKVTGKQMIAEGYFQ